MSNLPPISSKISNLPPISFLITNLPSRSFIFTKVPLRFSAIVLSQQPPKLPTIPLRNPGNLESPNPLRQRLYHDKLIQQLKLLLRPGEQVL
jgi:hypothetical protein